MSKEVTVKILTVPIKKLVHSESNPRLIDRAEHEELMQSLTDFPEMKKLREIIVDENWLILAGDKRTYALEELGYSDVEVKQVTGLPESKKREFIIKDNHHNGKWDVSILLRDWNIEELKGWGVKNFKMPGSDDNKPKNKEYKNHDVTCPNCGEHFDLSEAASSEE